MTEMTTEQVPSDQVEPDQVLSEHELSEQVLSEQGSSAPADQQVEVNGNIEITGHVEVVGDSMVSAEAELHAGGELVEVPSDAGAGAVADADGDQADADADEADGVVDEADDSDKGDGSDEGDGDVDEDGTPAEGSGAKKATALRRLEEEGEVAADYLEELLDIIDLDGDIDIDVENGRASVAIVAENGAERDLRRLVGSKGEVLEALQDLARLAVQARTGERSRLMLDVAGFRAARRRALEDIAARACQEVSRTGAPVRLDPMSAFERKVVHDVVADAGLVSESEGEDPGRRVVIHPAGS